jgi:class 3 adenylate cyclase/CheY-like chemotaxis protein
MTGNPDPLIEANVERPARILVVDDTPMNIKILEAVLAPQGYEVLPAGSGQDALDRAIMNSPDLVLLDIVMPEMDGYEVCRRLRANPATQALPVIMITASGEQERIRALEAGADDFVQKPFNHAELLARVRSLLRIKAYYDTIQAQTAELARWNRTLEARVAEQVEQLERLSQLRRFLSPQIAEAIVSGGERPLEAHRREITVAFLDLRGFTAFTDTAEPEDVMDVLHEYHAAMGELIFRHEGTLEHFAGDGMMVFFNDPLPIADPAGQAVRMALAMRERAVELAAAWQRRGHELALGMGIAMGYATLGKIGFEGRFDYGAIGSVTNMAARLCGEARAGQILIPRRIVGALEDVVEAEPVGDLELKGFSRPITTYNVVRLKATAPAEAGANKAE